MTSPTEFDWINAAKQIWNANPNPHPSSGQIGCMTRRLAGLHKAELRLKQELAFVHAAQKVTLNAIDNFIANVPRRQWR